MTRTRLGGTFLIAVLAVLALLAAPPAQAHTELVSSTPADGATLDALPTSVDMVFSEDLLPSSVVISVVNGDGTVVRIADPTVSGADAAFPWPGWPGTPASDSWSVNYRVVSQDGHPVQGSIAFTVPSAAGGASSSPSPSVAASTSTTSTTAPITTADADSGSSGSRLVVSLVGLAVAIGLGVALLLVLRRRRTP